MAAEHHQLHDLGPVAAIGAGLQVELDRADQPVAVVCRQQMAPARAHGIDHACPMRFGLGIRQGCQKTDRGAALDRVAQQPDEFGGARLDLRRRERADQHHAVGAIQVGRPSIG